MIINLIIKIVILFIRYSDICKYEIIHDLVVSFDLVLECIVSFDSFEYGRLGVP